MEARRLAEPRRKMESWWRERGEVRGVRSEAGEGGAWGDVVVGGGGGGGGLSWEVELLAGGADDRVIMRMIGSFCRASMERGARRGQVAWRRREKAAGGCGPPRRCLRVVRPFRRLSIVAQGSTECPDSFGNARETK